MSSPPAPSGGYGVSRQPLAFPGMESVPCCESMLSFFPAVCIAGSSDDDDDGNDVVVEGRPVQAKGCEITS